MQALNGKSIEQQQLDLERKQLGEGGCMACRSNPCHWLPYLKDGEGAIGNRVAILKDEIERVKRNKEVRCT